MGVLCLISVKVKVEIFRIKVVSPLFFRHLVQIVDLNNPSNKHHRRFSHYSLNSQSEILDLYPGFRYKLL